MFFDKNDKHEKNAPLKWHVEIDFIKRVKFTCGYCGVYTAPHGVFRTDTRYRTIPTGVYICSNCLRPTFLDFGGEIQVPSPLVGREIGHLPENIEKLYTEARKCIQAGAYTAAVMCFRTLLMYIAVDKGAPEGKRFIDYVNYLNDENYIPREGREWVDELRKKGNIANHQIVIMDKQDAEKLLDFVEMLLLINYDFPNRLSKK